MKKTVSMLLLLMICSAVMSQKLILEPQIGIRSFQYQSNRNYPYSARFLPSASAGARLMYISKNGHGPYIGFFTNSLIVNDRSVINSYTANINLLTFEAGYQWMSKPIYFKRIWDNHISHEDFERMAKKGLSVRIMPSLGISYITPANPSPASVYVLKKATIGPTMGIGFAFSKNDRRLFNLNFSYTRGLYDLYNRGSGSTGPGYLATQASGFNITLGVPITLFRKK
ncbi:MAG: hypothetical protein ACJ749_04100 [Flavisolibacter sp.]